MSTVDFLLKSSPAAGVGADIGDVINNPLRQLIQAFGSSPGAGAAYNFKPGVHWPVRNAKLDYGATFDGVTDDYAALQAAADDATENIDAALRTIALPPGVANLSKPLWLKANGTRLIGMHQGFNTGIRNTRLRANFAAGPTVFIGAATATVPNIVSALVGTGSAWQMVGDSYFFNLRDCATLDLNGLSAFTLRCHFSSTDGVGGRTIVASNGKLFLGDSGSTCFQLSLNVAGQIAFLLTTSVTGSTTVHHTSAVVPGTSYEVEASYDGSTLRLFVDGALVASSAVTGTLVQQPLEDVILGPTFQVATELLLLTSAAKGTIDSLEIAKTARHTSGYTKNTSKYTKDTQTLALMNWVTQYGPFTSVDTNISGGAGIFWAWCRHGNFEGTISGEIAGIMFAPVGGGSCASGIYATHSSNSWNFHRLLFSGTRNGLFVPMGDSYFWRATDIMYIAPSTGGRYGMYMGGNAFGNVTNFVAFGGMTQLSMVGTVSGSYCLAGSDTVCQASFRNNSSVGAPSSVSGISFSTEIGVGANFRSNVAISIGAGVSGTGAVLSGCQLENGSGKPHIITDLADTVIADGCLFKVTGAPTSIINNVRAPSKSAVIRHCIQYPPSQFTPWASSAGQAVVDPLGALSSVTYSATPTFVCDVRDSFELSTALTGDLTPTFTRMTPKQEITLLVKQDGSGGHAVNFGSEVKLASAVDTVANHYSLWTFEVALDGKLYQKSFASGA